MLGGFYSYPWGHKKTWQIGCGANLHRNKISKKCEENKAKIFDIVMKIRRFYPPDLTRPHYTRYEDILGNLIALNIKENMVNNICHSLVLLLRRAI